MTEWFGASVGSGCPSCVFRQLINHLSSCYSIESKKVI
ncbi:hypothetical protein KIS4809_0560 [Bacillus sp. ZZV12-4809]|nr:hypothetical protein KIS4809_0560 [Bacillus sp. ZZV12-4809]